MTSPRSPRFFLMSAVIVRASNHARLLQHLARYRSKFGCKPQSSIKFRKIKNSTRRHYLVDGIGHNGGRCVCVVIDKRALTSEAWLQKDKLYFYGLRYLLERISWLCDAYKGRAGSPLCEIRISHKRATTYTRLYEYLDTLKGLDTQIRWQAISSPDHVKIAGPSVYDGLYLPDISCGAFNCGTREDQQWNETWAKLIRKAVYRGPPSPRMYFSYGLKFHPQRPNGHLRFNWIKDYEGEE